MSNPIKVLYSKLVNYIKWREIYRHNFVILSMRGSARGPLFDRVKELKKQTGSQYRDYEAYQLATIVKSLDKIPGDVAEVGCYSGFTSRIIGENKGNKAQHLFDTFDGGLPEKTKEDADAKYREGDYADSLENVQKVMRGIESVKLHKGWFPRETGNAVKDRKFSFVNLDVDLYKGTFESLEFFYPRMNKGAVIMSHDYDEVGVRKAFDEFFSDKAEIVIELLGAQCLVTKV